MSILQAFLLGAIQGATEFIPVSSSGHLTLVPWLFGWQFDPVLKNAFDVMAHWGTLVAVTAVFWRDLVALVRGGLGTLDGLRVGGLDGFRARLQRDVDGRLAWLLVLGSIPAAVLGLLFEGFFESLFGTPVIVSLLMIVTAGLLAFSEWYGRRDRVLQELGWSSALGIGLGQAIAIAPGISRSGATIASGLLGGLERAEAARFSFLLSLPVILGAGVWQLKDLFESAGWQAGLVPMLVGLSASAVVGYASIRFLLAYLRQHRLYPFAAYCLLVGIAGLLVSLFR
jgi:undecaprenyl-diphosphatase